MICSNKQRLRDRITAVLVIVTTVLLLSLLAYLLLVPNVEITQTRESCDLTPVENVSRREIYNPMAPLGVVTEYRFTLTDNLFTDPHLVFYTVHQYAEVYIDGQKVYSLNRSGALESFGIRTIGCNYVMVPMYREDADKEILVLLTPVYESVRDRQLEFSVGSGHAIFRHQFAEDFSVLMLSLLLIFGGVVFVCAAVYLLLAKKRGKSVLMHGIVATTLGLCRLMDTRFMAMVFPARATLLSYLSIAMLMVCAIPLIKSVKIHLGTESQDLLDWLCVVFSVNCVIQLALQLLGILELRQMLTLTHILNAAGGVILVVIAVRDFRKDPEKHRADIWQWMCLLLVVGVIADTAAYYRNGTSSKLIITMATYLVYTIVTGISLGSQFFDNEIQVERTKVQLAQDRVSAMASQIRSHFVFNILNAISGMCKYDPVAADRTVVLFARYLRNNIDTLETEESVPFRTALRHLEDYVALEKVRFGDKINFTKDIQTDRFLLPPLIMQPIAENAIKHGLTVKPEGGTIHLRTWQEEGMVHIAISDNGVGFDTAALLKENSIGLKNVDYRIRQILKGSLTVDSTPGKGATVTITIPYEEVM